MRVVAELPHSEYKLTVFAWNNKYLLKVETAWYEQTYKISETDLSSDEDMKAVIADEEFMAAVLNNFKAMHQAWQSAISKVL